MIDKDSDEFRYSLIRDYVRLWDDRNVIYLEANRKCYQYYNATNSLMMVDVKHSPMGTRFLLCKDKVLSPKENWTNVNKTKVSDTQFNQSQQEYPVDDVYDARMTMISPGMYGYHQCTTVEQKQRLTLKFRLGLKLLINPRPNPFLVQLRDKTIYLREDPIQSNIVVHSRILIRAE